MRVLRLVPGASDTLHAHGGQHTATTLMEEKWSQGRVEVSLTVSAVSVVQESIVPMR